VTIFRIGNRQKMQGEFGRLLLKVAKWHDSARRGALDIERANFVWGPVPGMKEGPNRCFRLGPSFTLSPGVRSSAISAITALQAFTVHLAPRAMVLQALFLELPSAIPSQTQQAGAKEL
jgi:hypothetical protein